MTRQCVLLSVADVRAEYGIKKDTLYRLFRRGVLHKVRLPGINRTYIARKEIETLIANAMADSEVELETRFRKQA